MYVLYDAWRMGEGGKDRELCAVTKKVTKKEGRQGGYKSMSVSGGGDR
jgi:hypothetical protein